MFFPSFFVSLRAKQEEKQYHCALQWDNSNGTMQWYNYTKAGLAEAWQIQNKEPNFNRKHESEHLFPPFPP